MENKLMIFENDAFGKVRTLNLNGEPWFVAADVCSVLDLSNPTIAVSRLDEDERAKFNLGRQGDATIVNEPGLYTLVLGSRKPELMSPSSNSPPSIFERSADLSFPSSLLILK